MKELTAWPVSMCTLPHEYRLPRRLNFLYFCSRHAERCFFFFFSYNCFTDLSYDTIYPSHDRGCGRGCPACQMNDININSSGMHLQDQTKIQISLSRRLCGSHSLFGTWFKSSLVRRIIHGYRSAVCDAAALWAQKAGPSVGTAGVTPLPLPNIRFNRVGCRSWSRHDC